MSDEDQHHKQGLAIAVIASLLLLAVCLMCGTARLIIAAVPIIVRKRRRPLHGTNTVAGSCDSFSMEETFKKISHAYSDLVVNYDVAIGGGTFSSVFEGKSVA